MSFICDSLRSLTIYCPIIAQVSDVCNTSHASELFCIDVRIRMDIKSIRSYNGSSRAADSAGQASLDLENVVNIELMPYFSI